MRLSDHALPRGKQDKGRGSRAKKSTTAGGPNTVHLGPVRPELVEGPSYAARLRPFDKLTTQPERIKLAKRTVLRVAPSQPLQPAEQPRI